MKLDEDFARYFLLEPGIDYLNHGSFGACPVPVLAAQQRFREALERSPTRFMTRELQPLLDAARAALGELIDAPAEELFFVPNTTTGVNVVLGSLTFAPGDELLATDHTYNACKNALAHAAQKAGGKVVYARVPFPIASEDEVVEALLAAVTPRTRLLLIDHVTSPTGLVLPVQRLVAEMHARGVQVLVDGAHAPGLLSFSVRSLGADFYTGNCHKWLCTPKGSAFVHVARGDAAGVRPLVISHGATAPAGERPRLWLEHDWVGTVDPTPFLCIPEAIAFLSSLVPGGLPGLQARNHALALHARDLLCEAIGIAPPAPDSMLAALIALPLPPARELAPTDDAAKGLLAKPVDPLQARLFDAHNVQAIVSYFPATPARLLRVCAQAYNSAPQYARLAGVLRAELSHAP
jgi:isopenicillin-N epimerase